MHKGVKHVVAAGLGMAMLAGCGGGAKEDAAGGGEAKVAATDGWDASDACALLDKAAVGEALKDQVVEATVGLVNKADGVNAGSSECTYALASGGRASLLARKSPIADNTPDAIAQTRSATAKTVAAFTDKPVEDVPGLGKAAFFVPGINALNVFLDDSRFVILTIGTAPRDSAKETAVALAGKIKP